MQTNTGKIKKNLSINLTALQRKEAHFFIMYNEITSFF